MGKTPKTAQIQTNQIRALVQQSGVDEAARTVSLVWTTGSKGIRSGWEGQYYEELSLDPAHVDMTRLQSGAPLLASHNSQGLDDVIGVVERAWLEGNEGKALVRFSDDPKSDLIFQKVKTGILRNVSVGYSVSQYTDVSGPKDKVPTYRATHWTPAELSIVAIPFDKHAQIRSENNQPNEVEIIERAEDHQHSQESNMPPEIKETPEVKAPAVDVAAERALAAKEATAQERARVTAITSAVRAAKLDASFGQDLINRGLATAEASAEIFRKMEEESAKTPVTSGNASAAVVVTRNEVDTAKEGATEYLMHKLNPKSPLSENGKRFMGRSLVHMAEHLIGRPVGLNDIQIATRAMSTSDLPNILANVAEKSMRAEYQIQEPTFKPFTKTGTLRNYKTANRLMLGDFPSLTAVNEQGEITEGAVSESKETIKLSRYAKSIAFTKEMLINDDLGALVDFSTKSARAAARLDSSLVYGVLSSNPTMGDGNALFSASHGNLAASGTAITVAAMSSAWQAISTQKSLDGVDYLNLMPKFLVVGPAKEMEARQFISQNLLANTVSAINIFAGRLTVVVDPRISGNAWYVSADPAMIDTIELVHLESEPGPTVLTVQNPMKPGSINIICEHNAGASVLDFRGMYSNPGN
jgi:hypothetical protein